MEGGEGEQPDTIIDGRPYAREGARRHMSSDTIACQPREAYRHLRKKTCSQSQTTMTRMKERGRPYTSHVANEIGVFKPTFSKILNEQDKQVSYRLT